MSNPNQPPKPDPDDIARLEGEGGPSFYRSEGISTPVSREELGGTSIGRWLGGSDAVVEYLDPTDSRDSEPPAAA